MRKDDKTYHIKIRGVSPLIMQNSAAADPDNQWNRQMKPLKAKRKRTDSENKQIQDLQFLSNLYWSEELNGIYMPVDNVRKMLLEAGRSCDQKGAKKQIVGVRYNDYLGWPLDVSSRDDIDALVEDKRFRYFKMVNISKAKVPSVRAIFKEWAFEFDIMIDESIVNPSTIEHWFDYAGDRIGLGCRRPYAPTPGEFGRFILDDFKQV